VETPVTCRMTPGKRYRQERTSATGPAQERTRVSAWCGAAVTARRSSPDTTQGGRDEHVGCPQRRRERDRERQGRRSQARGGRHPRLGCRSREGVRREPRVAARRGLPVRQPLSGHPVHTARLGGLVQFGTNIMSTARLGPGPFTPSSRTSDLRAVSPEWDLSPWWCATPGTRATSRSSMAGTSGT
jgi:hypothetical protein